MEFLWHESLFFLEILERPAEAPNNFLEKKAFMAKNEVESGK